MCNFKAASGDTWRVGRACSLEAGAQFADVPVSLVVEMKGANPGLTVDSHAFLGSLEGIPVQCVMFSLLYGQACHGCRGRANPREE